MIVRVTVTCAGGVSVSYEYPVQQDGDIEQAVREAIHEWRKANPSQTLLNDGCSIKVEKV